MMMLMTKQFHFGSLKGRFPLSAAEALDAFVEALRGRHWDGYAEGLKVLHWPTALMKPWDHCAGSRTAFDGLWWSLRDALCSGSGGACRRDACADGLWF
mmetsp:Transcript_53347/g.135359  ORF Transcript_53347/g.135359 Transcript_53347/m.135359 type:complete len:99 (-) Transcript_53347:3-299(-)